MGGVDICGMPGYASDVSAHFSCLFFSIHAISYTESPCGTNNGPCGSKSKRSILVTLRSFSCLNCSCLKCSCLNCSCLKCFCLKSNSLNFNLKGLEQQAPILNFSFASALCIHACYPYTLIPGLAAGSRSKKSTSYMRHPRRVYHKPGGAWHYWHYWHSLRPSRIAGVAPWPSPRDQS